MKVGNLRVLMELRPNPVTDQILHHSIAKGVNIVIDGIGNLVKVTACSGVLDSFEKALLCGSDKLLRLRAYLSYRMCP